METLLLAFLFVVNFAISVWNAYVCGKTWAETKAMGGWRRFITWVAAAMSAIGFTWCYLLLVAVGLFYFHVITALQFEMALKIGFVVLAPAVVFASWMITIDSWANAYRNGGVLNYGVAGYNTFASIHNTMSLVSNWGDAVGDIFGALGGSGKSSSSSSSSSDDNSGIAVVVGLIIVVVVASLGILTTVAIIKKVSASDRLPSLEELRERRRLEGKPDVA